MYLVNETARFEVDQITLGSAIRNTMPPDSTHLCLRAPVKQRVPQVLQETPLDLARVAQSDIVDVEARWVPDPLGSLAKMYVQVMTLNAAYRPGMLMSVHA